jgi:CheY-like chemotaxis protein
MMAKLSKILLVEDDPHDVELTLSALTENHLTNEIAVARDGAKALDYLYQRGAYRSPYRRQTNPLGYAQALPPCSKVKSRTEGSSAEEPFTAPD